MMNVENNFDILIHSSIDYTITKKAIESLIFVRWVNGLKENFDLKSITIHNVFMFGKRVGFIVSEADAYFNNKKVPGIAFLRGDSVSIMPILHCNDEVYTIMVTEPRIPIAYTEQTGFPCGMVDDDSVNVAALKELSEEVGPEFDISVSDLIDLGTFPISSGGCDEYMSLKAFEIYVNMELLDSLHNRMNISEKESEQIEVSVHKLSDVGNIKNIDARSMLSKLLWDTNLYGKQKL